MAEKELKRVRSKFVDKVTKEVINQLLDDILEDHIVNDGEKDSILQENNSRADKARCLIDTVRRKGDEASRKMIAHLQRRDPTLFATLGLSSGPPAQPATEPQMEEKWSDTLIPTTEAFWREKQNDKDIYPVTKASIRSRVALLITNIKFTDKKLDRNGAEKDEQNMEKVLTALGYEVVKYTNLTGKEIDDALIKFSKHPKLEETDSVFVVIMSHGKLGTIIGANHKQEEPDEFPTDNIYTHLDTRKCPALLKKPKIIIIQACRGEKGGSVLVSDSTKQPFVSAGEEDIEEDVLRYEHKEKNFVSLLSCTPETVAYRDKRYGSIFIKYIVEVVNTFAQKDDIEELFRKVMQRFEDFVVYNKRQMPTKDRCTLQKRFYLFPGLSVL
ncbi:hypothetical protein PAMP_014197 [Pampus punctatissimus]